MAIGWLFVEVGAWRPDIQTDKSIDMCKEPSWNRIETGVKRERKATSTDLSPIVCTKDGCFHNFYLLHEYTSLFLKKKKKVTLFRHFISAYKNLVLLLNTFPKLSLSQFNVHVNHLWILLKFKRSLRPGILHF